MFFIHLLFIENALLFFQQLHSEILIKEENIIIIETIIEELASDPKLNVDTIKAQSNKLKEKHGEMTHDLLKKKEKLSEYIVYIEEYYIIIEEITIWVTHAKKNTALTDPIATETKVLKRQLKYLEVRVDFSCCFFWTNFFRFDVLRIILWWKQDDHISQKSLRLKSLPEKYSRIKPLW